MESRPEILVDNVTRGEFPAYVARIAKIKDNPEKLIRYMLKHAHWSPFEHSYYTFVVEVKRSIGRQLLRHRSMTFQEVSTRYEEQNQFVYPEQRRQHEKNRQSSTEPIYLDYLFDHLLETYKLYNRAIEDGASRETARDILPECGLSRMLVTGNLRSWFHFVSVRDDLHAQKDIQELAARIKELIMEDINLWQM